MNLILDASVAVKWFLQEEGSETALDLKRHWIAGTHAFAAPDVLPVEIAHAITRAERRGLLTTIQGLTIMGEMLDLIPDLHPSLPLLARAYEISSEMRIGVYDCLYVALWEQENAPLVTADDRLVNVLSPRFLIRSLGEFAES